MKATLKSWHLILAVLGALAGAIAGFPLSPILKPALDQPSPISYRALGGTVWSGWIEGLRAGPDALGRADIRLSPVSFLGGKVGLDVALSGGVAQGQGRVLKGLGAGLGVRNLVLTLDGALLARFQTGLIGEGGQVQVKLDRLDLDRTGCTQARGSIRTDLLVSAIPGWSGPVLEGPVTCQEGRLIAVLDGLAPNLEQVSVRIEVDGTIAALSARMVTPDASLQMALESIGFERQGDAYVYRWSGPLVPG
jgi:general secretion pathway protein N